MIAKNKPKVNMITAKQNQKFPFHFFFRFAVEGWGEETREKCKEIFRVAAREARARPEAQSASPCAPMRTQKYKATTRSARCSHCPFSKWVRAKANISPQKETSEFERWEEARAEGAGVGKRARREAMNWDGMGVAKCADLSLFHI